MRGGARRAFKDFEEVGSETQRRGDGDLKECCCVTLLSAVRQPSVASRSPLHQGPLPASPLSQEFLKKNFHFKQPLLGFTAGFTADTLTLYLKNEMTMTQTSTSSVVLTSVPHAVSMTLEGAKRTTQ